MMNFFKTTPARIKHKSGHIEKQKVYESGIQMGYMISETGARMNVEIFYAYASKYITCGYENGYERRICTKLDDMFSETYAATPATSFSCNLFLLRTFLSSGSGLSRETGLGHLFL